MFFDSFFIDFTKLLTTDSDTTTTTTNYHDGNDGDKEEEEEEEEDDKEEEEDDRARDLSRLEPLIHHFDRPFRCHVTRFNHRHPFPTTP
jgi:hypothetical protein